ncbi:MAG: vitamin B12-dependent ribonucleotide reductase [Actinomycetota bacterium]
MMAIAPHPLGLGIGRRFTTAGFDPLDLLAWERRAARLTDVRDGVVVLEQLDVEVPAGWSVNATNIAAQTYLHGALGGAERETSLRHVIERIVGAITAWGERDGYFLDADEAATFRAELSHLLANQMVAFTSPVWRNIGVRGVPQQASACFILSVDDNLESVLAWYAQGGRIVNGGSGAGINLSTLRGSMEGFRGGGTASGPVAFMRGADASAGSITSVGMVTSAGATNTGRATNRVLLDADHPDIEDFVWCKANEQRKARALEAAGFDMGFDGADIHSVQYQNANNSVRVTDAFMQAVLDDDDWHLTARTTGTAVRTVNARDLFRQIADAAWECADPGVQFATTIDDWHTASNTGPITASDPSSAYIHLDDSACNVASLNLLAFLTGDDTDGINGFDVDGFGHAVRVLLTAQEILVGNADYPTQSIAETTRAFRQLGLGYANLGALLMALGHAYDSDRARAIAASITALMTGEAYRQSSRLAERMGPFAGFHDNREPMLRVLNKHRAAAAEIDEELAPTLLLDAAREAWDDACDRASTDGVRNAHVTVLAPTATTGLLMDSDTTGIEPDVGLVKHQQLVDGATTTLVNQTVPRALRLLGYDEAVIDGIVAHIDTHQTAVGAPDLRPEHLDVFACSLGDNAIHHLGHLKMMGAVQPFVSGAISKTVNLPESASVEEVELLLIEAWRMGLKSVALFRDNCKVAEPLPIGRRETQLDPEAVEHTATQATDVVVQVVEKVAAQPVREKLPRSRASRTFEFRVADCKGFVTVGEYDDGRPGEIFVRVSKQGSTLAGIMDALAISLSHGLQYGVPLTAFVEAFVGMRFEPAGMTDDDDIRIATSVMDYLFRKLAIMYLDDDERFGLGILATDERLEPTLPGLVEQITETAQGSEIPADPPSVPSPSELVAQLEFGADDAPVEPVAAHRPDVLVGVRSAVDAPMCMTCGVSMQRSGSAFVCADCGATSERR